MPLALIFTNDWELFGDGSGDYFTLQHRPLLELLGLFKEYGAKLSVMSEVGQQLAHLKIAEKEPWAKKIASSWENVLRQTIAAGHDVQLHLHPQWLDSERISGKWQLNQRRWSIASLSPEQIADSLRIGKDYLESVLRQVKPEYQCVCFRAGAYYIEPSAAVIEKLLELGFGCDTSVTKWLVSPPHFDYSDAFSNIIPWFVSKEGIKYKSNEASGLVEMPIYSEPGINSEVLQKYLPKLYYRLRFGAEVGDSELEWMKKRDSIKNKLYPKSSRLYRTNIKKNFRWYISKFISKSAVQLDYDYLPASAFVSIIEKIAAGKSSNSLGNQLPLPVIASGHVKDMHSIDNIEAILSCLKSRFGSDVKYATISEAHDLIRRNAELIK